MQGHQLMRARPDDQQRRVDDAAEHPAVGQAQHGRPVEDHAVVMVRERDQQLPQLERAQDLDRDRSRVAGRDEVEVGDLGVADRALPGQLAPEDVDQPVDLRFRIVVDEDVGQAGPAEVDVQEARSARRPGRRWPPG